MEGTACATGSVSQSWELRSLYPQLQYRVRVTLEHARGHLGMSFVELADAVGTMGLWRSSSGVWTVALIAIILRRIRPNKLIHNRRDLACSSSSSSSSQHWMGGLLDRLLINGRCGLLPWPPASYSRRAVSTASRYASSSSSSWKSKTSSATTAAALNGAVWLRTPLPLCRW